MIVKDEELVPVMVPRGVLGKVHQVVAEHYSSAQPTDAPTSPNGLSEADWTPEEVKRLVDESPPGALVILEALANRAGEVVGADELAQALRERLPAFKGPSKPDANWNTVAGTNGAMARRIKSHHGRSWPFGSQLDADGRWANSMSVELAAMVRPHLERRPEK